MASVGTMYKVAQVKASLQEPLLGKDSGEIEPNQKGDADRGDEPEKRTLLGTTRQKVVVGVGGACAIINAAHIGVLAGSTVSQGTKVVGYIASGVGVAVPVPVALQESTMALEKSFRTALNKLRVDVDDFKVENKKITENINNLEIQVDSLKEIEQVLDEITRQQDTDLKSFMSLIEEDKRISRQMRENLQKRVLEDVIALVMQCDSDGDFSLDVNEIEELVLGINAMDCVDFNEDAFRKQVQDRNGSVGAVISLIQSLVTDDAGDETIKVQDSKRISRKVRSSFHGNSPEGMFFSSPRTVS